ncbi:unnamed protein product [Withania somnifera]
MASTSIFGFLFFSSLLLFSQYFIVSSKGQGLPPIVKGLSWTFFDSSCPKLESIVRKRLEKVFKDDIGQAAGLLRLHFHDCFVQGCDGSVMLDGSAGGPSEKTAIPNLTLRKESFKIIEDLRERVHKECGRIVSCSDIAALAARDAVVLTGGPNYVVPLGRKDGLNFATENATLNNLVPPFANTTTLLTSLATKGFDPTDVVALSGAHTIGISHCTSFTDRLYPNQDSTMDKAFANNLKRSCPKIDSNNTVNMDTRAFYVDQDLFTDRRTRGIVTSFGRDQKVFFDKFVIAMIKMGQLNVLTRGQGEIRAKCSVRNKDKLLADVVQGLEKTLSAAF